jgi:uncharacterized membrane protein
LALFHALILWLHILSVALWLGGMLFFLIVFGPAVHSLPPGTAARVLDRGRQRFETLSWIAIGFVLFTGILNLVFRAMSGSLASIGYYSVLGIKLLFFLAMIFHHCLQAFKYGSRIVALTAGGREELESWPEPLLSHWKKWFVLLKINATLGAIVLLLGLALSRI